MAAGVLADGAVRGGACLELMEGQKAHRIVTGVFPVIFVDLRALNSLSLSSMRAYGSLFALMFLASMPVLYCNEAIDAQDEERVRQFLALPTTDLIAKF